MMGQYQNGSIFKLSSNWACSKGSSLGLITSLASGLKIQHDLFSMSKSHICLQMCEFFHTKVYLDILTNVFHHNNPLTKFRLEFEDTGYLLSHNYYRYYIHNWAVTSYKDTIYTPELSKDITGTSSILSSKDTGTKLSNGLQEIQVVAAHKVLGQVDDGGHQRGLNDKNVFNWWTNEIALLDISVLFVLSWNNMGIYSQKWWIECSETVFLLLA